MRIRNLHDQIEADLQREYQIDFADWHTGKISSRRVMVLLKNLSETSSYRTAFERDGNWPVWQQMLKHLTNETALHRASLYAGGENEYEPTIYVDPVELREFAEEDAIDVIGQHNAEEELYGALGWT